MRVHGRDGIKLLCEMFGIQKPQAVKQVTVTAAHDSAVMITVEAFASDVGPQIDRINKHQFIVTITPV